MGRSDFQRRLRDLHGADAEIIETEAAGQSWRPLVGPQPQPRFLGHWPQWLRVQAGILGLVILVPLLAVEVALGCVGLFVLYLIAAQVAHSIWGG